MIFTSALCRIEEVTDVAAGNVNQTVTAGSVVKVTGTRLKLGGDDWSVSFAPALEDGTMNTDTTSWVKVEESNIFRNKPKELNFFVPSTLTAGSSYYIVVRTSFVSSGTSRKEAVQTASCALTVNEAV